MRAGTTVAWYQAASFAGAPFLLFFFLLCMDPDWLQVKSKTTWSQGAREVQGNVGEKSVENEKHLKHSKVIPSNL